jgi:hypothetical protein
MISAVISIGTGGAWVPTTGATVGLHIAMCFTQGIANSLGPKVMTGINCKYNNTILIVIVVVFLY